MGHAGGKIEIAAGADSPHRAGGDTQVAGEARVEGERLAGPVDGAVYENGFEQDKVAEAGMNYVAVFPHAPEARCFGDDLMADIPDFKVAPAVHVHGEAHRRHYAAHAVPIEFLENAARSLSDLVDGAVKFIVGGVAFGTLQIFAVHHLNDGDERLHARIDF
ncbi:MAG: hypothetical protein JSU88_11960 [Nitrospinaceae bacterium]|nr:MAG: hypothetical protein JSU88_11960 [Nitrospinaceae bacterium]